MKSFLINLLVVLSLALCAFNGIQWYREAKLHGRLESLSGDLYRKSGEIQNLQQNLRLKDDEIKRIEGIREALQGTVKSNKVQLAELDTAADSLRKELEIEKAKAGQIDQYKDAFTKANDNLRRQNEIIQSQNEKMKQLADDRNSMVERFNKLAVDYKSLGDDYSKVLGMYTNLVEQVRTANQKGSK